MTDLARKFAGAETTATTRLTCWSLQGLGTGSVSTVSSWGLTNTCRVPLLPLTPPPGILTNTSLIRFFLIFGYVMVMRESNDSFGEYLAMPYTICLLNSIKTIGKR